MKDVRIVFMGTPEFASNILAGLLSNGYNIVGVVTQPDQKVGRKQIITQSPVKEIALKYSLPIFQPQKIRNEYTDILNLKPDLIITCAYGQIIPKEILDYPKFKCINTHGSLLPKYRGGSPIQRSIINGDKKTGITIMYMDEKMDEGDILYQKSIPIEMNDTNSSLFDKLSDLALSMLLNYLPKFLKGEINPIKQNNELATYAYNLKKEDEFICFNDDIINVYNHIRGMLDNPGCYCILDDKQYKLLKVGYEETNIEKPNVFKGLENNYLRIDCKNGFIKVFEIKPESKNGMDAKAFFNGVGKTLINKEFREYING